MDKNPIYRNKNNLLEGVFLGDSKKAYFAKLKNNDLTIVFYRHFRNVAQVLHKSVMKSRLLSSRFFARAESGTFGCHFANKGAFAKCRFALEARSLCLFCFCATVILPACAQRWLGKLGAHSAVAPLMKEPVRKSPFPPYRPRFLSPSITLRLLFPSHSSAHLFSPKTTSP